MTSMPEDPCPGGFSVDDQFSALGLAVVAMFADGCASVTITQYDDGEGYTLVSEP